MEDSSNTTDEGGSSMSELVRPRDLFRPSSTMTMTKKQSNRTNRSNQLPQIPSSMSLHSFRTLPTTPTNPTTATMTKSNGSRRIVARTPTATTSGTKFLDLPSPAASKQHYTISSSSSTHDFTEYNGKNRSCLDMFDVECWMCVFRWILKTRNIH